MNEEKLIEKIKQLKEIKPNKDWVFQLKKEIFSQEVEPKIDWLSVFTFVPRHKLAFATLTVVFVLIGVFGFAQNSLPGEFLYPVKKVVEMAQINLAAKEQKPRLQLELANKRLADIAKIAEANEAKKLAPAVEEFQASVSQAAKNLTEIAKTEIAEPGRTTKISKEVVLEVQKLEEQKQKIEDLGIIVGKTEELNDALAQLVEREIKDLEGRALTESQQELLLEAKETSENGNYSQALETILKASQISE